MVFVEARLEAPSQNLEAAGVRSGGTVKVTLPLPHGHTPLTRGTPDELAPYPTVPQAFEARTR